MGSYFLKMFLIQRKLLLIVQRYQSSKTEVKSALGNMISSKTSGNDGLTSEFYKAFWSELRSLLLLRYKSFLSGELNISQKQAVIKLIGKKD